MVSVQNDRVSPDLEKTASTTGIVWSANSPEVRISCCSQRARAILSA
jgi:hypothetical protein